MEHFKIFKLLRDSTISKFVTKERIKINYLLDGQHSANKNMRLNTPMLSLNLWGFSDVYIFAKGRIRVTVTNHSNRRNKKLAFKNSVSFTSCNSKNNNTFIDNVEDLEIVMPMYNLL